MLEQLINTPRKINMHEYQRMGKYIYQAQNWQEICKIIFGMTQWKPQKQSYK